ncbi:MAG: hypothetical protein SNG14_08390 [Rikenellaceae bacterium]
MESNCFGQLCGQLCGHFCGHFCGQLCGQLCGHFCGQATTALMPGGQPASWLLAGLRCWA